jgi:transposase InsO family protein
MELTGINQLWVADITYIRLQGEFVFLAVMLDRHSRTVVGWALDRSLSVRLTVTALRRAIEQRQPGQGVVHHSDRGVQYAAHEYVEVLHEYGMIASMSRPGNPYDNAICERFMRTLKEEEIECKQYRNLPDLERHIEQFIDEYYNCQRLHSALGYRTPAEFEQSVTMSCAAQPLAKMSFSRHTEIYQSDRECE